MSQVFWYDMTWHDMTWHPDIICQMRGDWPPLYLNIQETAFVHSLACGRSGILWHVLFCRPPGDNYHDFRYYLATQYQRQLRFYAEKIKQRRKITIHLAKYETCVYVWPMAMVICPTWFHYISRAMRCYLVCKWTFLSPFLGKDSSYQ